MKKVVPEVKPNKDKYELDKINCYEKPVGILLDSYATNYSNVFYMFLKLFQSYYTQEFICKEGNADSDGFIYDVNEIFIYDIRYVIENKLGYKFIENLSSESVHEFIRRHIDSKTPVLVNGNLRELFYTPYYKTSDWAHLFLITGYDDEKEIYFTMDECQKRSAGYEEFAIEFSVMEKMYKSYQNIYNSKGMYYIEIDSNNKGLKILDLLIDCINVLVCSIGKLPFKEADIISYILKLISQGSYKEGIRFCSILNRNINYKYVLYNELTYIVSMFIKDKEFIDRLEQQRALLIERWNHVANICTIDCFRHKSFDVRKKVSIASQSEEDMKNCLLDIKRLLNDKYLEKSHKTEYDMRLFENNEDKIITTDKLNYLFDFNTGKLYNSWLDDDAPRVFLNSMNSSVNGFQFKTHMKIEPYSGQLMFHSGIVFRTHDGKLYFWGNYCGEYLLLERIGEVSTLERVHLEGNNVILQISKKENTYVFEYSFDSDKEMCTAYTIDNIKDMCQIGIGCKTWSNYGRLKIEFIDNKIISEQCESQSIKVL
ncbi:MAG: BtrH N-terminal domain-containing protein [Clostridia bacterium]|nr:BtrH N-terminal domain-containing protein [Clostridia bacterium]